MTFPQINILAAIVGAVITMVLGMAWYSPMLFGNRWLKLIGKTMEQLQGQNAPVIYLFTFVGYLIAALVLAVVVKLFGANTLVDGVIAGGVVWLGFVATSTYTYTTFEGPPKGVWAIYMGYQLIAFGIMGALLAVWK